MSKFGGRRGGRHSQWRDVLIGSGSGECNQRDGKNKDLDFEYDDGGSEENDAEFVNDFAVTELQPKQIEEILYLNASDHPEMSLVSTPLMAMNFLNWSRSVRRALGAKSKLELLDGTLPEPGPEVSYYKHWVKADYMISSWIINSISKELVGAFSHIDSTRKLWIALCKRFGRCNGPKIYKPQREIF